MYGSCMVQVQFIYSSNKVFVEFNSFAVCTVNAWTEIITQKFVPEQDNVKAKVCGFMVVTFALFEEVLHLTLSVFYCFIVACSLLHMIFIVFNLLKQNCIIITIPWYASSSQYHLFLQQLKNIQNCRPKSKKRTVYIQWKHVQDTKSTKPVSFVQPVCLLKTTNANLANTSPTIIKKGWTYEATFLKVWNVDGEHSVQSTKQRFCQSTPKFKRSLWRPWKTSSNESKWRTN